MLKLISNEPYFYEEEPSIRILDTDGIQGLTKSAADQEILKYVSNLKPEPGRVYLHILAMGAGEYFGANRNQDYFPENNLRDCYKTFETSPAHVFRNHVNKNPEIAIGQVVFAIYNERMHRVELIAWVDKEKGRDVVERIEAGDYPNTSMACKTPFDVCAVCGNKAHTRQEYCEHLSDELGRMYPDGKKAMALNIAPLRFFDISIVHRPADVTSSVLQKVASEQGRFVSSAELAEVEGLTEKTAGFKKLSEFIKEITEGGQIVDHSDNIYDMLDKVKDPDGDIINLLRNYDTKTVLESLAHLGISPSLGWLAEFIARKSLGEKGQGLGDLVEGYVAEVGVEGLPIAEKDFGEPEGPSRAVVHALSPFVKQASLMPEHVAARAMIRDGNIYLPGTNVGYFDNGPHVEPTPFERYSVNNPVQTGKDGGLAHTIKTLMVIGGAALAAKWYITQAIERNMKRYFDSKRSEAVKIGLVEKHASDFRSTYRLAESDMVRTIKRK